MSCRTNFDKAKQAAAVAGIAGGVSLALAGGMVAVKRIRQQQKVKQAQRQAQAREQERQKYAEAKTAGKFYNPLTGQKAGQKYLVAGRYLWQGQPQLDKIELHHEGQARQLAAATGYSLWQVTANQADEGPLTYTLTDLATGEQFPSPQEPYGRRQTSRGSFEAARPEADEPHEIIDTRSNKIVRE